MSDAPHVMFQFEKGKEYDIAYAHGVFYGTVEIVKPGGSGRNDRVRLFIFTTENGYFACRPEYSESDGAIIVTMWQAYRGKDLESLYAAAKHVDVCEPV